MWGSLSVSTLTDRLIRKATWRGGYSDTRRWESLLLSGIPSFLCLCWILWMIHSTVITLTCRLQACFYLTAGVEDRRKTKLHTQLQARPQQGGRASLSAGRMNGGRSYECRASQTPQRPPISQLPNLFIENRDAAIQVQQHDNNDHLNTVRTFFKR